MLSSRQAKDESYRLRSITALCRLVRQADLTPHRSARGLGDRSWLLVSCRSSCPRQIANGVANPLPTSRPRAARTGENGPTASASSRSRVAL